MIYVVSDGSLFRTHIGDGTKDVTCHREVFVTVVSGKTKIENTKPLFVRLAISHFKHEIGGLDVAVNHSFIMSMLQ